MFGRALTLFAASHRGRVMPAIRERAKLSSKENIQKGTEGPAPTGNGDVPFWVDKDTLAQRTERSHLAYLREKIGRIRHDSDNQSEWFAIAMENKDRRMSDLNKRVAEMSKGKASMGSFIYGGNKAASVCLLSTGALLGTGATIAFCPRLPRLPHPSLAGWDDWARRKCDHNAPERGANDI